MMNEDFRISIFKNSRLYRLYYGNNVLSTMLNSSPKSDMVMFCVDLMFQNMIIDVEHAYMTNELVLEVYEYAKTY